MWSGPPSTASTWHPRSPTLEPQDPVDLNSDDGLGLPQSTTVSFAAGLKSKRAPKFLRAFAGGVHLLAVSLHGHHRPQHHSGCASTGTAEQSRSRRRRSQLDRAWRGDGLPLPRSHRRVPWTLDGSPTPGLQRRYYTTVQCPLPLAQ